LKLNKEIEMNIETENETKMSYFGYKSIDHRRLE